jgi:hypothetical protein
MSEPLFEETEIAWQETLNRFDEHIWPMFRDRGYTKGEAHILWALGQLAVDLHEVNEKMESSI